MNDFLPIPWVTDINKILSLWVWETPHFRVQVTTDELQNHYTWEITDLSQGRKQALYDGFSMGFKDAEKAIRETIGKSYPVSLGYRKYAGDLATTFVIFTKERIDFGPMEATRVLMKVRSLNPANGIIGERMIAGVLRIVNYTLEVIPEHGSGVTVPPSHILSIKQEYGGMATEKKQDNIGNLASIRTYRGTVSNGCTGKPGMLPGTVEHSTRAAWCPIHDS